MLSTLFFFEELSNDGFGGENQDASIGLIGVVKKHRTLYMIGQTRVHLDRVEDLGHFMELEVVLREEQAEKEGVKIAEEIMSQLGIRQESLIECAYFDLLTK